jgi:putative transposase
VAFIDAHRERLGVEPIGAQVPIAPSVDYMHKARQQDPTRLPPRRQRDEALGREIRRVYDENCQVYGARKVWRQLQREGFTVARCTVERLMRALGLSGVRRGARCRTTVPETQAERPVDHVNRPCQATRPNELWGPTSVCRSTRLRR